MPTTEALSDFTLPVTLHPQSTALVIIDMMYLSACRTTGMGRWLDENGRAEEGRYRFDRIEQLLLPNIGRLLMFFRQHDLHRVHVKRAAHARRDPRRGSTQPEARSSVWQPGREHRGTRSFLNWLHSRTRRSFANSGSKRGIFPIGPRRRARPDLSPRVARPGPCRPREFGGERPEHDTIALGSRTTERRGDAMGRPSGRIHESEHHAADQSTARGPLSRAPRASSPPGTRWCRWPVCACCSREATRSMRPWPRASPRPSSSRRRRTRCAASAWPSSTMLERDRASR